jgi:hypothetical protein
MAQPWGNDFLTTRGNFGTIRNNANVYFQKAGTAKGSGFKQYKRWEYYWKNRVNRDGTFPAANVRQIEMGKYKPGLKGVIQAEGANWTSLGPNSSSGGYGGIGRINRVAFHPSDANTFYACTAGGGLWKTSNGGTSWTTLTSGLSRIGTSDLVIHPTTPDVMYLATGDCDGFDTPSLGVFKSTDGGSSWNATGLSFTDGQNVVIFKLVMHASNTSILIAATNAGIYRTTDAGATWTRVFSSAIIYDLEKKPGDATTLYACSGTQIYTSADAGVTWTSRTTISGGRRIALAVSPANTSFVGALVAKSSDSGFLGFYGSTDSGVTWASRSTSPNLLGWNPSGNDSGGQGWYDLCLSIDPANANNIYVGGVNTWKSTNGGTSWALNTMWYATGSTPEVHADKHDIAFQNNSTLYQCNDGGIYKSTNGGTSWTDLTNGMSISQLYKIGVSQTDTKVIAGLQDNGTKLRSTTGTWSDEIGGDGMDCAIDPSNGNIMYGELYYGDIYRSTNGGSGWSAIAPDIGSEGAGWVTPFALAPSAPATIYIGYQNLYKSTNNGTSWTRMTNGVTGGYIINNIAIAPSDANVVYFSSDQYLNSGGNLYKTTDGGSTTTTLTKPNSSGYINGIAIDNTNPNNVWVCMGGYSAGLKVYKSTNGGSTWTNISGTLPNLPANCLAYANGSNGALYLGMDVGVYYIDNTLSDWVQFNTGLPNAEVFDLEIQYATSTIKAGTYGRGLWESPLFAGADSTLTVSPTSQTPSSSAGSFTITVTANVDWSASSDAGWLTVSPTSGSNNGTVTATYTANTGAARTGSITFTAGTLTQTVTVTQAIPVEISVSPTTQSVSAAAGNFAITLSSNTAWTVSSNAAWLTASPTSGASNASVTANFTANTGAARTGILTFSAGGVTRTVTVTQATPALTVSPTTQAVAAAAGNFAITLTSNVNWTVSSNAAWLTAAPTSGSNNGSITASYTANTGAARTGVLTFSGSGLTRTVTVTQATPNLAVTPATQSVSPVEGSFAITLTSNVAWTVSSNAAWLSAGDASGSNNATVNANYADNTGASSRSGILTFTGGGLSRTVTVTQAAPSLTVTPTTSAPTPAAGSFAITLTSNIPWTVSSNAEWLTVTPTSGSNNGTLTASYTANTDAARTGILIFSGGGLTRTVTVTQVAPTLSVTPTTQARTSALGSFTTTLTSNVAWTVSSNAAWLTTTVSSGSNDATVTANYTANTGDERTGVLTFTGGGITRTVTVTQAAPPILTVSPSTQAVSAAAGNFQVALTGNVAWTVASNSSWLIATPTSGSNNGTVTANFTGNTTAAARTGILTFTGGGLTRTVTVTQATPNLAVTPATQSVSPVEGSFAITLTSNVAWTVSSNAAWLSAGDASGSNNATVNANYADNTGASSRSGILTFTGGGLSRTVTVTQAAPSLTVTPTTSAPTPAAGSFAITLTSNIPWTVSSNAEWLTVTPTSGSNNGTLTASYTATVAARTGILTITGGGLTRTVTVTQGGTILSVSPETQARTSAAGTFTTALTSNVAWTVSSNAAWLTTTVSLGSNNATVTANYTANTGDARTGVLTFTGGSITRTVTVTQAAPPILTVSPATQSVSPIAGNFAIALTSNIAWTVSSNAAWLTATPTSGSNNGTVTANFTGNTTAAARTGILTFTGGGLTRTVTITQATPALAVSSATQAVPALSGSFSISLTSNVNWTVASNAAWLTTSTSSGSDNGSITANYTANTGIARTGTLTFSGGGLIITVVVTQATPALTVSPATSSATAAEGSFAITVTSSINWTVASNAGWLTASTASGTGNATVTANYYGNTGALRTGILTFTGSGITRTVTVTQASPTLAVTPTTQAPTAAAGSFATTLTSNVAWTVSSNVEWLTVTPTSGSNNGTLTTSYTANTDAARTGILTITGGGTTRTVTVTQAAPTLSVAPTTQSRTSSAGSFTTTLTSNVAWTVSSNAAWLTTTVSSGSNNATVTANYTANTGDARTGVLTFTGGSITSTRTVTVTQAAPPILTVSPATQSVSPIAGNFAIALTSNIAWTVSSNAAWLTATPTSGSNNGTVTANFTGNTTAAARTGILTFTGGGLTRTVTITQATPALAVSSATQAVPALSGSFSISLTSNVNWTVASNAAWLTTSTSSGSDNGSITANYTANTGIARTGTLTFSGGGLIITVVVTQATPALTVSPATSSATAAEGSFAITVTSSINWTVASNAGWLTASTASGTGNATVTANYYGNTGALRTGILTFTGSGITRTVTVTQASPTLAVTPTTQAPTAAAGSFATTLTSNVAWTVSSNVEWLTVTPTSGSNNGTLTTSYTANTDAARTGILTITGGGLTRTVTVTQAAPTLSVTPTTQSRTSAAGSFTTTLTSNVAWTVVSDVVWLTTTVSSGSNNATVTANYTANTGEARTGILIFTGGGVSRTVTVTQAPPPVLTVSPATQSVSPIAGNFAITLTSNIAWTVSSNAAWLTATPTSSSNNGTVTANFTGNTGSATRTGILTFSGGGLTRTVTVSQAAPNLTVTPTTNSVSPLTGSVTITLTSNVNWTVTSNAGWLTTSPTSGSNNGSITANYTANTGSARTGTLTFSGNGINRTVDVTQAAPTLTVSPTTSTRTAAEGSFAITLTSNINWTVTSNAGWLTTTTASGTGNTTVTANYTGNTGALRAGILTFTGSGITRTVTVTQAAPTLAVTPATQSRTTAAGSFTTTLTSNVAWTVSSNVPWLTTTTSSGSNNASVIANYTANLTAVRVGILTFTGGGITRTVTVNQAGLPAYLIVSPLVKSVVATADTFQFSVVSNIPWTVSNSGTWLMPGVAGGSNNGTGFAYFQQNNNSLMRRDTVYVSGLGITRKIVVTQDEGSAAGVTLEVESNAINAAATAAMVSDSITSNGCWTISESASWIMSGVSEGSGNAKITLYLQPNTTGVSRSAVVTVSTNGISRSITITQSAATSFTSAATLDEFVKQLTFTTKSEARVPRIELYPNPAQNMVNLVFDALDNRDQSPRLVVFDGMGRIVVQKENTSNLQQLDVSNFATGMYIFNFYLSDNKIINKKLIINRN